jgi:NAD(P)-dependent dehydrogenase (short-subunit alcohol dehydrogenase family)
MIRCLGTTDSEMLRKTARERRLDAGEYAAMIPDGRFAAGEDHANTIAWLASEEAGRMLGQVISVDGGQSLSQPLTLKD